MKDIIITGKQGSGKSEFAYKNFGGGDYEIIDEATLEDAKRLSSYSDRSEKPYVFITQDPINGFAIRRFIVISMPDNG